MRNRILYRGFSLLMVCVFMLSLFSGCSSNKTQPPVSNSQTKQEDNNSQETSKTNGLPIVKQPLTITYWTAMSSKVSGTSKNYSELGCFRELEKRTGITIKFLHPPVGQEKEQFNLMIASGDLPDIIYWDWPNILGGPGKAIEDGLIIKLNDLINKNAPNLKAIFDKNKDAKNQSMMDDGTYYMFPFIKPEREARTYFGPQVRKDWLDKLGIAIPQKIDDWYTMMKAMKNKDLNGNNQNDEIPFVAEKINGLAWFASSWGIQKDFYKVDGKIKFGPVESVYKDFLTTMRKWYTEGLIDPDYASTDTKQFDAKVTGHKAGTFFGLASGNMGRYLNLLKDKDPKFNLEAAQWPVGPAGKSYNIHGDIARAIPGPGAAISKKSKYSVEIAKWADYQYSEEGNLIMNFGIEGESYKMVNGYPTYTDLVLKNPDGLTPDQAIAKYAATFGSTNQYDTRYLMQTMALPQQKAALQLWSKADDSLALMPLTPLTNESERFASIMSEVYTYTDEMFNKFIMGEESLDNFDKYVQTLKRMGIEEAIKMKQGALDRYNSRK